MNVKSVTKLFSSHICGASSQWQILESGKHLNLDLNHHEIKRSFPFTRFISWAHDRHTRNLYEKLALKSRTRNLHKIEHALFDARNSREKYLAASRYSLWHTYKFLARVNSHEFLGRVFRASVMGFTKQNQENYLIDCAVGALNIINNRYMTWMYVGILCTGRFSILIAGKALRVLLML